jgi:hypothetical protein
MDREPNPCPNLIPQYYSDQRSSYKSATACYQPLFTHVYLSSPITVLYFKLFEETPVEDKFECQNPKFQTPVKRKTRGFTGQANSNAQTPK